MTYSWQINHINEWSSVCSELIPHLIHNIVLVNGEMGFGKTTLIKNLVMALGYTDETSSPTFSVVNLYESPLFKGYHIDAYRLKNTQEGFESGLDDVIQSGDWCFIEWPKVLLPIIESQYHSIEISLNKTTQQRTLMLRS